MGFSLSIVILTQHKWAWYYQVLKNRGKEAPRVPMSDIIPDTPAYRRWLKQNPVDPRITDMKFGVVFKGAY